MKLCKRFLSLALALCMTLALLPTTAFATVSSISASKKVACLPTTGLVADFPAAATFSFGVEPKRTVNIGYSPIKYAETDTENQYYKEIKALTEKLISGCDTDTKKAKAIQKWITANVKYESGAIADEEDVTRVYTTYTTRIANCQGYAYLTGFMLYFAGIPNGTVTSINHMWNIALLDGKWVMIDSTGGLFNISNKKLTGMHTVHHITFAQGDCIYIVDDATGIKLAGVSNHWYNREGVTSVTIPENVPVNSIASCAFRNCTSLTSVTIPDTVTQIGSGAFYKCESLTGITIPDGVTYIGGNAFRFCDGLTSINVPDSVTEIGEGAFSECSNLTSVTLPSRITTMGSYYRCTKLTDFTIPDGVTLIDSNMFYECKSLTSIIIPDSVTEIKYKAFANCTNLKSVTIGNGVAKLNLYAFAGCPNLSSLTIPSNVTEITNSFYQNGQKSASFKNLTIYGEAGSCAETYAQKNGYRFVASDAPNQNDTPDWSTNVPSQSSIPVENIGIPNQSDIPVKDTGVPNQNGVSIGSINAAKTASGWAQAEVASAIAAGLVPGSLQLRYQSNITREEFCTLMVRLVEQISGQPIDNYLAARSLTRPQIFTDTGNTDVHAAYALGIVKGISSTTFNPSGSITRQEAAAMLARTARVLGLNAGTPMRFADAGTISSWAVGEVDYISGITDPGTGRQVMGGVGSQRFEPLGSYTREQAIATALRLYGAAGGIG